MSHVNVILISFQGYSDIKEFMKQCMMSVVREFCPEKKGTFENIHLSERTVT